MEKKNIEEVKAKLLQINDFVLKLDPSIRSAAFEMLLPKYFGKDSSQKNQEPEDKNESNSGAAGKSKDAPTELATFIKPHNHKKPADNALMLAAWLYSTYGVYPITAKELRELGDSCGLVIPGRPDNTMRQATKQGKSIFSQQGKGWKPTVNGEIYLQDKYRVKKGNKPFPKE